MSRNAEQPKTGRRPYASPTALGRRLFPPDSRCKASFALPQINYTLP